MAQSQNIAYTCLTCSLGFMQADHQRSHYSSDLHRYNAKRKVAGLPPVSAKVFDQKVLERRAAQEAAEDSQAPKWQCDDCGKSFASENAHRDHLQSKKHKLAVAAGKRPARPANAHLTTPSSTHPLTAHAAAAAQVVTATVSVSEPTAGTSSDLTPKDPEQETKSLASVFIPPLSCLFCPTQLPSRELQLSHMQLKHGFFIPDSEYLVDLPGLIDYLAEDIAIGNLCIYCGAGFGPRVAEGEEPTEPQLRRGVEAVRKHMDAKSHSKIAWDTQQQRLELSDFYDFSKSYDVDDGPEVPEDDGNEEWEDASVSGTESDSFDLIEGTNVRYGDSPFELILPSGARIGHRALKSVYTQNLVPYLNGPQGRTSALSRAVEIHERRLARNESSALVPARGAGYGPGGTVSKEVIRAKNKGEAKHAGRNMREFREQRARLNFQTKIGFVHNSQKHFRDPLLQ